MRICNVYKVKYSYVESWKAHHSYFLLHQHDTGSKITQRIFRGVERPCIVLAPREWAAEALDMRRKPSYHLLWS